MKRLSLRYIANIEGFSVRAITNFLHCVTELPVEVASPISTFDVYYFEPEEAQIFRHIGSFFLLCEQGNGREHIVETGGCDRLKDDGHGNLRFRGFCSRLGKHVDFHCVSAADLAEPRRQPMSV